VRPGALRAGWASALVLAAAGAGAQTAPKPAPTPAAAPSVKALVERARADLRLNNARAAVESARRARELAPNSEEVLVAFADAALAARTSVPAVDALAALVRLAPTVAAYHYRLGRAWLEVGDAEAAGAALRESDRLEPNREQTLAALGTALNRRGLHSEAKAVLLRAASLDPEGADVQDALAEAEEALGETAAAEARAERVLSRVAADGVANRVLGLVRLKQERFAEARDALVKAAAADPGAPLVQESLATVYTKLGEPVLAKKHEDAARLAETQRAERVAEARRLTGFAADEARP
jgi:tetratricopeptide (TPR) repeat protein